LKGRSPCGGLFGEATRRRRGPLDRKQRIVRRQSPEVTAAERELYTLEDDCGERDRRVRDARRATAYHNSFVKLMVNLAPMLAETIHGLEWFIASVPPGKAFVTCDAPIIITRPRNHNPLLGVGLTTPGSEKIVPLASRLALLMGGQVVRPWWTRAAPVGTH